MTTSEIRPPLFTNRQLVSLAIPIMIDALLSIMAGLVDSAMVSSAGEAAVSAISLVDSVNLLFITFLSSIAIGGSVITAQYIGSKNLNKASQSANQALYAVISIALCFVAFLLVFHEPILKLVYGNIDPEVYENACTYFFYIILGYPCFAIGATSTATLRAMGKTRSSMIIAGSTNIANIFGNAILIYGFGLGVAGAAISTTLCRVLYAVLGLILAHNPKLPARYTQLLKFRIDTDIMKRVLKVGLANGLENSLFQIGKVLISSLVATFGTIYTAGFSVSFTINNLGWTLVGSVGTVMLTVVGQCIGAGQPAQARSYAKKLLGAATVLTVLLFGTVFLFRNQVVQLFDFSQEALDIAAYYTAFCSLGSIIAVYSFTFLPNSAFRAAGDIRYPMTVSVICMFTIRVGLSYLLNFLFPEMGITCVYLAMWIDWVVRSILNVIRFRGNKWLTKQLI